MRALIDLDIVAYRCAASCEPTKVKLEREPLDLAIRRADELMYRILNETGTDEYLGFMSGGDNFRYHYYADYKANRKDKPKPVYLDQVRSFLASEWNAKLALGYETDDAIGIAYRDGDVICSIDKDLLQIPGLHYNFVTFELKDISGVDAAHNFWHQMLMGDRSDNIPGLPGIGDAKANKILNGIEPQHMKEIVFRLYDSYDLNVDFDITYKLLRILRSEEEWYNICKDLDLEDSFSESEGTKFAEASERRTAEESTGADQ